MTLVTAVLVVSTSVTEAIDRAPIASVAKADWVVQARSSSGMGLGELRRLRRRLPYATLAPVLTINTRLLGAGEKPLLIAGLTGEAAPFLPPPQRRAARRLANFSRLVHSPLVQSGLVLSRSWAEEQGLHVGSTVKVAGPTGTMRWRIAGLVGGAAANGGAIAVGSLPAVGRRFQREGVLDLVLARSKHSPARLEADLRRSAGAVAKVVPPNQTAASYARAFEPVQNLLQIFVGVVVLAAGGILFFSWRVALEDTREELARLRLCGADTFHLAGATALMLSGALLVSTLLGGVVGILLGSALSGFTGDLVSLSQLSASPELPVVGPLADAFAITSLVFAAVLCTSVWTIRRYQVIEAVVGRREATSAAPLRLALVVGFLCAALSLLALNFLGEDRRRVAILPLLVLILCAGIAAPVLFGNWISRSRWLTTMSIGRSLAFDSRNLGALLSVFGLAIALSLGLSGVAGSLKAGIDQGIESWTPNDLFIQTAASGKNLLDDKFSPHLRRSLARLRGVQSVGYYTYSTVDMHDTRVWLWTWGPPAAANRYADFQSVRGPSGQKLWGRLRHGKVVAVSSNYARLYDVGIGDEISVPGRSHVYPLRVVGVVDDLTSPAGMLLVGARQYRVITGDRRIYQFILSPASGSSTAELRHSVESLLSPSYPTLVTYDQSQIRRRFSELTGGLVNAFVVFGRIMLALALAVAASTLTISLAARRRSFALTRLVGGSVRHIQRQLALESVALGTLAWMIGMPIGIGLTIGLMSGVTSQTGLLPDIKLNWPLAVASLPLAIAMSFGSLLLSAPKRRIPVASEALREE